MVEGEIDTDGDNEPEVTIAGGFLAFLAIIIVSDIVFNGGQFTLGVVEAGLNAVTGS
ncbi:hypothetical protein HSRCO_3008 (plasmid) [Halanaeroarchaeum sp. HSR-CO]|uniref:hypothetical protein n=1 Tax=Halanaeroarchaeum sp. HSR-CO TaxID=2866382 RepID=UPI00217ED634|nr:hypothetical protein [Halanaeroarchaeum sp. HSR-CO]UWG49149.1 hypothetical protein HSRCO_3008 [Halanaeroarchaeum sp. HSR-CO]